MISMGAGSMADKLEDETLQELNQRKQELLYELRQYEEQRSRSQSSQKNEGRASLIDKDTRINARLVPSREDTCLYLTLESSNATLIKAAVVFADRLFDGGESIVVHERSPSSELRVPLRPPKDVSAELQIKALAGSRGSPTFHVFELSYTLPKFAMYVMVEPSSAKAPSAGITFTLPGAADSVRQWIAKTFNTRSPPDSQPGAGTVEFAFLSLRDGSPLWLRMTPENGGRMSDGGGDPSLGLSLILTLAIALALTQVRCKC